jgi:hypothetical protein
MLDQTALAEFKTSLAGELIQPGEKGYDEARQVYNGMIDRRPRLIARCADAADVIAAVNLAVRTECSLRCAVAGITQAAWAFVMMAS